MLATPRAEAVQREPDHNKVDNMKIRPWEFEGCQLCETARRRPLIRCPGPALWDRGEWCA